MDHVFIIAAVFLAVGIGLAAYHISYKQAVLQPMADEQWEKLQKMDCKQLMEYTPNGQFWSTKNDKWAREKVEECRKLLSP